MEISTVFLNFWLNQVQNCSVQIKKMKDRIFSLQLKKNCFWQTFTDNARLRTVPPPLDLTRILKSYHKRNDRKKFPEKIGAANATWDKSCRLIGQKPENGKTPFSKLTWKISYLTQGEELSKQVDFSCQTDTFHSFG